MKDRYIEVLSAESGRDKIGLIFADNTQIIVPSYYFDIKKKKVSELSKEEKNKIKRIILAWQKYQKRNKDLNYGIVEGEEQFYDYDLALEIVQDFIENGLYVEFESINKIRRCGKIEFPETIKRCKPLVTANGPVYLEYYTKLKKSVDQNILKNVQIQVLNEIAKLIGWMIGFNVHFDLESRPTRLNKSTVSQLIQLRNTSFNSRKIQLINYLIKYIEMNSDSSNDKENLVVATAYHFWEAMVSDTIGNISRNRLKKVYYVRHAYTNKNNGSVMWQSKPLMPDTISETEKAITVLDAKYYTNGNLPDNYDITKQFAYMDKAYSYFKQQKDEREFRNIMVLPTDQESRLSDLQIVFDPSIENTESKIPIELLYINFSEMLDAYLAGKKIDIEQII